MQTYSTYRPTPYDLAGLALPDQQHWLVLPVIQTRDSDALEQSNFAAALERLGGESDTVEVHRFGHWGPGWFEIVIVNPTDARAVSIAEGIEQALGLYPVLSEDDLSRREYAEYEQAWEHNLRHDFAACLQKVLGLCDTAAWRLWDADVPLRELYEELSPSGDYWEENNMCVRLEGAAGRCTRERMATFLKEHRTHKPTIEGVVQYLRAEHSPARRNTIPDPIARQDAVTAALQVIAGIHGPME